MRQQRTQAGDRPQVPWDSESLFYALARVTTLDGYRAARRLFTFVETCGAQFTFPTGTHAQVNVWLPIRGTRTHVLSMYDTGKHGSVSFDFGFIRHSASDQAITTFARRLRTTPAVAKSLLRLQRPGDDLHPSVHFDAVVDPSALDVIEAAIDELLATA